MEKSPLTSINAKIDNQEFRIFQRDAKEIKEQYEKARKREAEASQMLAIEMTRCKTQEMEIERSRRQLEESNEFIKKLQAELESARQIASGVKWELRENEMKSSREAEIVQYKSQITSLEAKLKRKQSELNAARDLQRRNQELMEKEIGDLKALLSRKEKDFDDTLSRIHGSMVHHESKETESLHQRIGSLTAINESLQDRITALQAEKVELDKKLQYADEDKSSLQREIHTLKEQLSDNEGVSQQMSTYWTDEIDKIKHQKAQLRCDYLQAKRCNSALENEVKTLKEEIERLNTEVVEKYEKKISEVVQEKESLRSDNLELRKNFATLECSVLDYQKKIEELERSIGENEACEEARIRQLTVDLEASRQETDMKHKVMLELDSQCEKLMCQLKALDQEKKTLRQDNRRLQKDMEHLKKDMESSCKMKNDFSSVCEENARLTLKVKYLENELQESHIDHRKELERLAEQIAKEQRSGDDGKPKELLPEELCSSTTLQNNLKMKESQCRFLERSVEQVKKELEAANNELSEMRKRQCDLVNDNTVLRQALNEAIKKGEEYRDINLDVKKSNDLLKADIERNVDKILNLEDTVHELRTELAQKEKLVGYLQSIQQQPQKMQKLRRNRSSCSTLISSGNETDIESENKQCDELQKERDRLRQNLEKQRRILSEKQNEVVPLLRNTSMPPPQFASSLPKDAPNKVLVPQSPRLGTMRHDIPHRWKTQFVSITTAQCAVCYDGLPHFGHVNKCRECTIMVHSRCMPEIVNTCGLPAACADFYLGAHSSADGSISMNGWVKLWRSDDRAGNKWRNAWATINNNRLSFYDNDSLAITNSPPFLTIDLDREHWRIFNQSNGKPVEDGIVSRENMSMVIEVKLLNFTLFMLTPTVQSKQRWVRALQCATNRRLTIQRRASSNASIYSLFLELERPQNLDIYCTQILDNEWLLIGCDQGLFVTQAQNPRAPFNVAGIPCVYFMELILEHDMLLIICSNTRSLAAIHLQQLRRTLRAECQQPMIQYTTISNIDNCHIAVVSKPEHSAKRYVYLATTTAITILQFVEKLGVFAPMKQIKTEEPCMCICSTQRGFIFGADNFHFVTFESDFTCIPLLVDNCPYDFPVAAVEISADEYLLAFHNYGICVTSGGKRTRKENVEWERIPLEFVYAGSYLYIVYCDFLEIARVADYEDDNTPILTDDRTMFKCHSAHRTGSGVRPSDVMFAVSTDERVELHTFHTSDLENSSGKGVLKRKLADTLTRPMAKKKH